MKDSINLLRKETSEEQKLRRQKAQRFLKMGAFVVAVLVPWFISLFVLFTVSTQEAAVARDIEARKKSITSQAQTELLYRDVYNRAQGATLVFEKHTTLASDIVQIKSTFNPNLTLKEFSFDKNGVAVGVATPDIGSAIDYLNNLEDKTKTQSFLKELNISSISVDKQNGYQVKIGAALLH